MYLNGWEERMLKGAPTKPMEQALFAFIVYLMTTFASLLTATICWVGFGMGEDLIMLSPAIGALITAAVMFAVYGIE